MQNEQIGPEVVHKYVERSDLLYAVWAVLLQLLLLYKKADLEALTPKPTFSVLLISNIRVLSARHHRDRIDVRRFLSQVGSFHSCRYVHM